eukprot:Pompholyxophrys_sp_v1_NODE_481_length_526_cov_35.953291.p2 type:complete len:106 gc:universal NODE_481_length_526_cov_35.953291:525-208(-)
MQFTRNYFKGYILTKSPKKWWKPPACHSVIGNVRAAFDITNAILFQQFKRFFLLVHQVHVPKRLERPPCRQPNSISPRVTFNKFSNVINSKSKSYPNTIFQSFVF